MLYYQGREIYKQEDEIYILLFKLQLSRFFEEQEEVLKFQIFQNFFEISYKHIPRKFRK